MMNVIFSEADECLIYHRGFIFQFILKGIKVTWNNLLYHIEPYLTDEERLQRGWYLFPHPLSDSERHDAKKMAIGAIQSAQNALKKKEKRVEEEKDKNQLPLI